SIAQARAPADLAFMAWRDASCRAALPARTQRVKHRRFQKPRLLLETRVEFRARRDYDMKTTLSLFIALVGFTTAAAAADAPQVTFTKDVAPIFQEHCQTCHHMGTVAPMSLVKYEEARPWARAIKQRVSAREMPPWFIDRNVGVQHFNNDESLTDEEIA